MLKCGFKIGGGIDQDYQKSPQGYTDNVRIMTFFHFLPMETMMLFFYQGIYVTEITENSAASKSGLHVHDKILQCNGYDFTMVTHKKAVSYIKKHPNLNMLVARKGVTQN